jgi:hypothetical protein
MQIQPNFTYGCEAILALLPHTYRPIEIEFGTVISEKESFLKIGAV